MSRRAGATVALYLEDKWPTYVQGRTSPVSKRGKTQIITAQNLLHSIGVPASEPNDMYFTSHLPHSCPSSSIPIQSICHFNPFLITSPHMCTAFPASTLFLKSHSTKL